MIEVKEVLRRWEAGQSLRRIAKETGLDRKTVRRYVAALKEADGEDSARVQQMVQAVQVRPPRQASRGRSSPRTVSRSKLGSFRRSRACGPYG